MDLSGSREEGLFPWRLFGRSTTRAFSFSEDLVLLSFGRLECRADDGCFSDRPVRSGFFVMLLAVPGFFAAMWDVLNVFGTFSLARMFRAFNVDNGLALVDWNGIVVVAEGGGRRGEEGVSKASARKGRPQVGGWGNERVYVWDKENVQ